MLATMLHIYILFFISISTASIILGLGPTNQQEYVIFGLLSLAYLTQHDPQFHPFSSK
jgi:hypothetical protein